LTAHAGRFRIGVGEYTAIERDRDLACYAAVAAGRNWNTEFNPMHKVVTPIRAATVRKRYAMRRRPLLHGRCPVGADRFLTGAALKAPTASSRARL
jgi:hypothetical protein